jgi:hypothetical protein
VDSVTQRAVIRAQQLAGPDGQSSDDRQCFIVRFVYGFARAAAHQPGPHLSWKMRERRAPQRIVHALELARLDSKQQIKLLSFLNVSENPFQPDKDEFNDDEQGGNADSDDGPSAPDWRQTGKSVAELKREIGRTMLRVLNDAPFSLEDQIDPVACGECPKRTVNSAMLFSDVAQDICTDADCYLGKIKFWIDFSLEQVKENRKSLLRLGSQYWYQDKEIVSKENVVVVGDDKPCEHMEEAIWLDGGKAGHRAHICRKTDCATHYGFDSPRRGGAQSAKELEKQKAERKKTLAKVNIQKRYRKNLFEALGQAKVESSTAEALSIDVALHCIGRMTSIYNSKFAAALGWNENLFGYEAHANLRKHLASLTAAERLRAAHLAIHASDLAIQEYSVNSKDCRPKGFEQLAGHLGVDAESLRIAAVERQAEKDKSRAPQKSDSAKLEPTPDTKTDAKTKKPAPVSKKSVQKKATKPARKKFAKKTK